MRNFIDKKAGASFLKDYSYTYAVRQSHVELIIKVNKGVYGIICLIPVGVDQLAITCGWGTFFNRLNNHENPGKLLQKLEKSCPTVCDLFTGQTPYSFISFPDENNIVPALSPHSRMSARHNTARYRCPYIDPGKHEIPLMY